MFKFKYTKESEFDWVRIPEGLDRSYLCKIVAKTTSPTDHTKDLTIPKEERVVRKYDPKELAEAARSLTMRHIDIAHNLEKTIPGAFIIDSQWNSDEQQIECIAYIPSEYWLNEIKSGRIKNVSIEQINRTDVKQPDGSIDVQGISFIGLALVPEGFKAGDANTSIEPMYEGFMKFEISEVTFPQRNESISSGSSAEEECNYKKRVEELEQAVTKLQNSVKTAETSKADAEASAYDKGKAEIIQKIEEVIPPNLIINRFNNSAIRLTQDIKKVLRENKS